MVEQKAAAIDSALRRIDGINKFLGRREIKELPSILWEDELPEMLVTGIYNNGNGILVATNRRLVFVNKGLMSFKMEDFSYDKITSIESKTGMLLGQITIYASGNKEEIKNVPKDLTRPFADFLRARLSGVRQPTAEPAETSVAVVSIADELEKLAALRDRGIVSDSEFDAQKTKLLGM